MVAAATPSLLLNQHHPQDCRCRCLGCCLLTALLLLCCRLVLLLLL